MSADPSILVTGDTLVDFVPNGPSPPGNTGEYTPRFGGSGANVTIALDRFDVPPPCWTRLAAGGLGEFLRTQFDASAIPPDPLVSDEDARTTLALVTHDAEGVVVCVLPGP